MALSRAKKTTLVESYEGGLAQAPNAILLGFQGITVAQVDDLRRRVREQGGHYSVIKNRLASRAVQGTALEQMADLFAGPTAVAFSDQDPVGLAKILTEFKKEVPVLEFKGGLVDGQRVEGEQIKDLAAMPSREELLAKLLFLLQSPITRFVRGLGAIPQQFVSVLDQVRQQKEA
jgi:large subunit ribosomal protein L10